MGTTGLEVALREFRPRVVPSSDKLLDSLVELANGPATAPGLDIVRGRFLELITDERIVQLVEFESEDPAFAGEMKMTWALTPVPEAPKLQSFVRTYPKEYDRKITRRV
jgi:hypothetical protein